MTDNADTENLVEVQPSGTLSTTLISTPGGSEKFWDAEVRIDSEVLKVRVNSLSSLLEAGAPASQSIENA